MEILGRVGVSQLCFLGFDTFRVPSMGVDRYLGTFRGISRVDRLWGYMEYIVGYFGILEVLIFLWNVQ